MMDERELTLLINEGKSGRVWVCFYVMRVAVGTALEP